MSPIHRFSTNSTVVLTGFQDRTGAGTTAMGEKVEPIYPEKVAAALNIGKVFTFQLEPS
jgi:hypothetical protein